MASDLSASGNSPAQSPSASTPPTVSKEGPVSPIVGTLPAASTALIKVDPIEPTAIQWKLQPMTAQLMGVENGAELMTRAQELSEKLTLKDFSALLAYAQEARDAIRAVSREMIGDTRINAAAAVEDLFNRMNRLEQQVDVDMLTRSASIYRPGEWLPKLGHAVGMKRFEPIVRFIRGFQQIQPYIENLEQEIVQHEVASQTSISQMGALKSTVIRAFRDFQVSIAAGEIAYDREFAAFTRDRDAKIGNADIVELQELHDRRVALVNLDTTIMRLQGSRGDSVLNLPLIDATINADEVLRSNLEQIRVTAIPQLLMAVAIQVRLNGIQKGAEVGRKVDEMTHDMRKRNIDALGVAQEKVQELALSAVNGVDSLIAGMKGVTDLTKRASQNLLDVTAKSKEARVKLEIAEREFTAGIEEALLTAVK